MSVPYFIHPRPCTPGTPDARLGVTDWGGAPAARFAALPAILCDAAMPYKPAGAAMGGGTAARHGLLVRPLAGRPPVFPGLPSWSARSVPPTRLILRQAGGRARPQLRSLHGAWRSRRQRHPCSTVWRTELRRRGSSKVRAAAAEETKSASYNEDMRRNMGWDQADPYQYYPERGLYYHEVWDGLFCGTQLQHPEDVDVLHSKEGISTVVTLQQDKDLAYWGVDGAAIAERAQQLGVDIIRCPVVDFDAHSLRGALPGAVRRIAEALAAGRNVYVHCTAGLGRAPAACIAYIYWYGGLTLDQAYQHVTAIRPCGPRRKAVQGATYDALGREPGGFEALPGDAFVDISAAERAALTHRLSKWD